MWQVIWIVFQVAVTAVVYSLIRKHNPDLSASSAAVAAFAAAFVATALPIAIYDLLLRLSRRRGLK